ncbi:protein BatD [candidate division WOR-3 bacterium]|nr:protein BatD [candidate division WOR-3 bacterium]
MLPERGISFFNPKSAQYYTLAIPRLEFVATGTPTAGSLEREQGVRVLGSDIAHIRTSPGPAGAGWALPWWNWLFYPAGAVFVFAGIVLGRHRRRLEQDRGYARRTRSSRLVKQRLKDARRHLAQGRLAEFYSALSQAAVGFVGDRFNVEAGGMTREQLLAALTARGVAADALAHFTELVGQCDVARFSPGMAGCEPQELLRRAQAMLEKL